MGSYKRLVLQYDDGQMTFRHVNSQASHAQLFELASAINELQDVVAKRILLVSVDLF